MAYSKEDIYRTSRNVASNLKENVISDLRNEWAFWENCTNDSKSESLSLSTTKHEFRMTGVLHCQVLQKSQEKRGERNTKFHKNAISDSLQEHSLREVASTGKLKWDGGWWGKEGLGGSRWQSGTLEPHLGWAFSFVLSSLRLYFLIGDYVVV